VVRESRTNTPLQALNLMNDVAFLEVSRKLAERVMRAQASPAARIEEAFRLVLARGPGREESAIFSGTLERFLQYYSGHVLEAKKFVAQGRAPRDASLAPAELAAYTAISSLLLNLDEAVTKE
jgi:hypothetical protein